MESFERQVGRSDNQAVAVQLKDQLEETVSNLQDKLNSAGCPTDTEDPLFQKKYSSLDNVLRQNLELKRTKK